MRRFVFALVGALLSAAAFFAVAFFGGYAVSLVAPDAGPALSMVIPMLVAPAAGIVGAVIGAWIGWRRG